MDSVDVEDGDGGGYRRGRSYMARDGRGCAKPQTEEMPLGRCAGAVGAGGSGAAVGCAARAAAEGSGCGGVVEMVLQLCERKTKVRVILSSMAKGHTRKIIDRSYTEDTPTRHAP
jgi:hypothetical protein